MFSGDYDTDYPNRAEQVQEMWEMCRQVHAPDASLSQPDSNGETKQFTIRFV
jgi:hypothetical protein